MISSYTNSFYLQTNYDNSVPGSNKCLDIFCFPLSLTQIVQIIGLDVYAKIMFRAPRRVKKNMINTTFQCQDQFFIAYVLDDISKNNLMFITPTRVQTKGIMKLLVTFRIECLLN